MDKATFKTIGEILAPAPGSPQKKITIPNYQRGYKWSVKHNNGNTEEPSAVEKLLTDLEEPFRSRSDYFLQGITVRETDDATLIIDGQQRLTTIYLLLWLLGGKEAVSDINIAYEVRKQSREFLARLKKMDWQSAKGELKPNEGDGQDTYFFKLALWQIAGWAAHIDAHAAMAEYVREHVRVIYITIDTPEKAVRTFAMMNGTKASMLDEELVKAEMLRLVSRPCPRTNTMPQTPEGVLDLLRDICAEDWEATSLRSRYAREWDKWLYWWNRADVREFFNVGTPMGLLLEYHYKGLAKGGKARFGFDTFKKECLDGENNLAGKKNAKATFAGLRHLQKSFEDIYNNATTYNWLGLSLRCDGSDEKYETITYFMENKNDASLLRRYAKCKMAGATHREITADDEEVQKRLAEKQAAFANCLKEPVVYDAHNAECYRFLTFLNIEEENKLNDSSRSKRKFDFSIWSNKSLEHIHPKSKVWHKGDDGRLYRGDGKPCNEQEVAEINGERGGWLARGHIESAAGHSLTEHCIGNLVLLYGSNNSEFGAKPFLEKKETFFDVASPGFKSRSLLHTISKFAKPKWGAEEIANYYNEIAKQLETLYGHK